MKTQEKINSEIITYLEKASGHTFIKPKTTFKWGDGTTHPTHVSYYEHDYENGSYFKVIKSDDGFLILDNGQLRKLDVDHYIKYYQKNAKCVIKNMLFGGRMVRGIKNTKFVKNQINEILGDNKNNKFKFQIDQIFKNKKLA